MTRKIIISIIIITTLLSGLLYYLVSETMLLNYLFKINQKYFENYIQQLNEENTIVSSGVIEEEIELKEESEIRGVIVEWRKARKDFQGVMYVGSKQIFVEGGELGDDVLVKISKLSKTGASGYAEVQQKYANYLNSGSINDLELNKTYSIITAGPNLGGEYFALYEDGKLIIQGANRSGEKMQVKYIGKDRKKYLAIIVQRNILN
ncbi:MAG TPA: hypothetical protein PLM75_02655 [bacterium]|nr:hypothetical protein [bacterium]HPP86746.1 hypothetical protein [bacterium]